MSRISALMLIITGVIHLLPLPGVMGSATLAKLYGVVIADPSIEVLLRHRAVMFALLGCLLIAAAVRPELRVTAYIAGLISAASFVAVAWLVGGYNALIGRVVVADILAVACLVVGAAVEWRLRQAG